MFFRGSAALHAGRRSRLQSACLVSVMSLNCIGEGRVVGRGLLLLEELSRLIRCVRLAYVTMVEEVT